MRHRRRGNCFGWMRRKRLKRTIMVTSFIIILKVYIREIRKRGYPESRLWPTSPIRTFTERTHEFESRRGYRCEHARHRTSPLSDSIWVQEGTLMHMSRKAITTRLVTSITEHFVVNGLNVRDWFDGRIECISDVRSKWYDYIIGRRDMYDTTSDTRVTVFIDDYWCKYGIWRLIEYDGR